MRDGPDRQQRQSAATIHAYAPGRQQAEHHALHRHHANGSAEPAGAEQLQIRQHHQNQDEIGEIMADLFQCQPQQKRHCGQRARARPAIAARSPGAAAPSRIRSHPRPPPRQTSPPIASTRFNHGAPVAGHHHPHDERRQHPQFQRRAVKDEREVRPAVVEHHHFVDHRQFEVGVRDRPRGCARFRQAAQSSTR